MKTKEMDLYHGPALTQIVHHDSFKAINKATTKYGHYLVNTDRHVFVKYRKNPSSRGSIRFRQMRQPRLPRGSERLRRYFFVSCVAN